MIGEQEKIKKLLEISPKEYFVANKARFECHFKGSSGKPFSEWKKDENSPSLFCEAHLRVYDCSKPEKPSCDGMILVQRDDSSASPFSAALYLKDSRDESWKTMFTITDLIV